MKISQSKVRVEPYKAMPVMNISANKVAIPKANAQKPTPASPVSLPKTPSPVKKAFMPTPPSIRPITENHSSPNETTNSLQRIRAIAQQELELIRRMRTEAVKYQQETAMRARSEAHQLVLHARLASQREIEELIRKASEEIQKVLADIRVIRITAQEELAAQRKFTDAAKLHTMSLSIKEAFQKPAEKKLKKQLVTVKS
jgi:hypothetical protein